MVVALLALALSLLGSSLASAQQIVNIAGDPVCDSCTIETEEVTVLVSPERVGLTPRDKIALASDGKVWVAPFAMPYALLRYLPDGTQDVWIEARGEGPREFNRIERVVVGPGGLLHVFGNGKVNRYSPAGELFLDTRRPVITPFRQILSVAIVPDGSRRRAGVPDLAYEAESIVWWDAMAQPKGPASALAASSNTPIARRDAASSQTPAMVGSDGRIQYYFYYC